jgi:hypothetical protein
MHLNSIYNLPDKISVPTTLALAEREMKKLFVGKRPISNLYNTLQMLDPDLEIYSVLKQEINDQLPEEAKKKLATFRKKRQERRKHKDVVDRLERVAVALETREENLTLAMPDSMGIANWEDMPLPKFPLHPKEMKVSNLKDIKFPEIKIPEFPKTIDIGNWPEVPTEIRVNNLGDITPTDTKPIVLAVEDQSDKLLGAMENLSELLKKPRKTHILNKKGDIIENFTPQVNVSGGGSGGGYSGIKDGNTFRPDHDYDLPVGGLYESSPSTLTSGDQGVIGLSAKRAVRTTLEDASGTPITSFGGDGALLDGANAAIKATVKDLTNSNPLTVAITDANGDQIVSFGGGSQYEDGTAVAGGQDGTVAMGTDGTNLQFIKTDANGELQVDVLTMPTVTVQATDLDIRNLVFATDKVDVSGSSGVGVTGTFWQATQPVSAASLPLPTGASTLAEQQTQTTALQLIDDTVATLGTTTYTEATTKGLTIGAVRRDADTTLVSATNEIGPLQMDANGRLKVEIFTGGETFAVLDTNSAAQLTALQLIDDTIIADDAAFTVATTKVSMAGFFADDTSHDAVNEGDGGAARMTVDRIIYTTNPQGDITTESKDCASASTAYQFTATGVKYNIWIEAPEQNNGVVTFGGSATYANNLARMRAGERRYIGTLKLEELYFGSSSAGDDVILYCTSASNS